jgi:hypothetical protein
MNASHQGFRGLSRETEGLERSELALDSPLEPWYPASSPTDSPEDQVFAELTPRLHP